MQKQSSLEKPKLALVTGSTSGLGEALCQKLASQGINLILTGRNRSKLIELSSELKHKVDVSYLSCDLRDPSSRKTLIDLIQLKTPDLVINNAGLGLYGEAISHQVKEQLEILEVNCHALLEISLESAKAMICHKKRGIILNISSAASFFPYPNFAVYSASKAFVNSFSQGLAYELSSYGIDVLVSCPGQIATSFRKHASKGFPQKKDRKTMSVEKATNLILRQIKRRIPIHIFDWRYRWAIRLIALFLPKKLIQKMLQKAIISRIEG